MIAQVVGLTLIFFLGFYFFLGNPYDTARGIQRTWAWSKEGKLGMFPDPRTSFEPEKRLNGYKTKSNYIRIPEGTETSIDDSNRIEYPITAKGFLSYKKIGSTVELFSEAGELLWTKEYKSYPRIHPDGNIILFLSGDNNQVLISDINGNSVGIKKLDGRFLTDLAFSPKSFSRGESAVLFSGGEIFLLDGKGNLLFSKTIGDKDPVFAKSLAVSSDGNRIAVHFLKGNRDYIRVFDQEGGEKEEWNLGKVFPHKINLAVSPEGEVLAGVPDALTLYSKKGKILFEKKRTKMNSVYQTVFHSGSWFAGEAEGILYFLNEKGVSLREERISSSEKPFRLFSPGIVGAAFMEGTKEIVFFQEQAR
ncbi:hypothetical protein LEP1GSC050_0922 [Leptospira broomii serovar Hurstbridge str. 5399]|uniref:WD40-like protein n=1 Tax=Leptospira broomii serovar Hurstbridge str. 5399 TaxID=1049789 RepID=T0GN87_9LEPT|nr:hypothetical protein [Leptospira broomii]EQA46803.1 hypothetical protein LEP1GSC050_0922 [Leptospira broomii serovar Hurstbridge str. 5399]